MNKLPPTRIKQCFEIKKIIYILLFINSNVMYVYMLYVTAVFKSANFLNIIDTYSYQ